MSSDLSPNSERFIRQAIELGAFRDRKEALDQAVELLEKRQKLLQHIDEGTQQLHRGEYTEYDEDGLRKLFDEVQAEGRERYEASKKDS